jgi:ribonuclease P protein subunit RPR2
VKVIRLLVCDDSGEARRLVRAVLADHPEIELVGEAADGVEAVALAAELEPDVVLMDIGMPSLDGAEATRQIRAARPETRVVAFTGLDDDESAQRMLEAGATSFVVKGAPLWELERAVQGASQPLLRLAHTLARTLGEQSALGFLARETSELTGAALAGVFLASEPELVPAGFGGPGAELEPDAWPRDTPRVVRRAFGDARPAAAGGRELIELYRTYGVPCGAATAVPLLADGERLGVLLIVMPANVQFELDSDLLGALADIAAGDLSSRRKLARSQAEARHDSLTLLRNRRAFDEHLESILEQATSREAPVTLVLVDLDEFKEINDTEGHSVGDRVLAAVARVLESRARTGEEVFRIGGDEFAIVVRGDAAAGFRAADRFRQAMLDHDGPEQLPALSAGVASYPGHGRNKETLVTHADEALYAAKNAGRNQVAVYASEGEEQPVVSPAASGGPPELSLVPPVLADELLRLPRTQGIRILVVDDQPNLRMLLRTTFEIIDVVVDEAGDAAEAMERLSTTLPDVIVLDIALPDIDGITLCRQLRDNPMTAGVPIVLLTGSSDASDDEGRAAGASAFVRKPFSPLELLETIEKLAGGLPQGPFRLMTEERPEEQLMLYAQDLRRLLELERTQRLIIQSAYEETVSALARALESKDFGTGEHSKRVTKYASQLTQHIYPSLMVDQSIEYGFLLHDMGKIGIPDNVLVKNGPLTDAERRIMETHTILGEQILDRVPLLQGEGLRIIRSHHERWDGTGYPDHLQGEEIPACARIFAVADALDAMTTYRPYRKTGTWNAAVEEIVDQSGKQFDPAVVDAFQACEPQLRRIFFELAAA